MTKELSLDDDVAAALAEEAERRGVPADQLANEELRGRFCSEQSRSRTPFVVKPFDSGFQPGIDPTKLKEYLYEEDEEPFRVKPFRTRLQPGMDPKRLKQILHEEDSAHFERVTFESRDHS